MTENKRYIPKWEKGKIIGAKDTELHLTLNVKIMIRELNAQNQRIKELEKEILDLKKEIGRLNRKKYMEKPYWQKEDNNVCFEQEVEDVMKY